MTTVRDPAFWKRFSMAVHLQEEEKGTIPIEDSKSATTTTTSVRPSLKHTESWWLEKHRRKQRRSRIVGCIIALVFLGGIAALVVVLMWIAKVGPFKPRT